MITKTKDLILVFVWLAVITVLEIGATMIDLQRQPLIIFILGTALSKAVLIALYFMHLKSEKKMFWWIPAVPVVLAVFFVLMLFPDMVYHLTLRLTSES